MNESSHVFISKICPNNESILKEMVVSYYVTQQTKASVEGKVCESTVNNASIVNKGIIE